MKFVKLKLKHQGGDVLIRRDRIDALCHVENKWWDKTGTKVTIIDYHTNIFAGGKLFAVDYKLTELEVMLGLREKYGPERL